MKKEQKIYRISTKSNPNLARYTAPSQRLAKIGYLEDLYGEKIHTSGKLEQAIQILTATEIK